MLLTQTYIKNSPKCNLYNAKYHRSGSLHDYESKCVTFIEYNVVEKNM